MKEYLSLLDEVLKFGVEKKDRTNVGTISVFGTQRRYSLEKNFPLITTKKIHWKSVVHELLWFIKGDTNIRYLVDNGVRIWNEWPYQKYKQSDEFNGESMQVFIEKIKKDNDFAKKWGDLGPVYGKQWRDFLGVDQLQELVYDLKNKPHSRRMIINAWNPVEIKQMILPPCHAFVQFYVANGKLSCQLYQRSADVFLGVPFNIASYSLLTLMLAHVLDLQPGEFIHTTGDTHIYLNHISQVQEQIKRQTQVLPQVKLNNSIKKIEDFKFDDIELIDYYPLAPIEAKVAI